MVNLQIRASDELNWKVEKVLELSSVGKKPYEKVGKQEYITYLIESGVEADLKRLVDDATQFASGLMETEIFRILMAHDINTNGIPELKDFATSGNEGDDTFLKAAVISKAPKKHQKELMESEKSVSEIMRFIDSLAGKKRK